LTGSQERFYQIAGVEKPIFESEMRQGCLT